MGQVRTVSEVACKLFKFPTNSSGKKKVLKLLRWYAVSYLTIFNSHHNIWRDAQVPQRTYHYYHPESKGLDFSALMDDIKVLKHVDISTPSHLTLQL